MHGQTLRSFDCRCSAVGAAVAITAVAAAADVAARDIIAVI